MFSLLYFYKVLGRVMFSFSTGDILSDRFIMEKLAEINDFMRIISPRYTRTDDLQQSKSLEEFDRLEEKLQRNPDDQQTLVSWLKLQ